MKLHPTTPTTSITKQRVLVLPEKNKNAGFIITPEPESDEGDVKKKYNRFINTCPNTIQFKLTRVQLIYDYETRVAVDSKRGCGCCCR